jgi:hypothetical protein
VHRGRGPASTVDRSAPRRGHHRVKVGHQSGPSVEGGGEGRPDDDRGVPGRPPGSPGEVENWAEHHGRSDQRGPISPLRPAATTASARELTPSFACSARTWLRTVLTAETGVVRPLVATPEIRCLVAPTAGCCPVFPREPRAHGYGSSSSSRPPQGQARGSTPPPARTSAHVAAGSPVARIDGAEASNLISRRHCV